MTLLLFWSLLGTELPPRAPELGLSQQLPVACQTVWLESRKTGKADQHLAISASSLYRKPLGVGVIWNLGPV